MFLEHFRTEEICFRTLDGLESMIDLKDIHLISVDAVKLNRVSVFFSVLLQKLKSELN